MVNQAVASNFFSDKVMSYSLLAVAAILFIVLGVINGSHAAGLKGTVVSLKGEVTQVKPNHLTVQYEGTLAGGARALVQRTFQVGTADMPNHTLTPGSQVQVWFWYGTNTATRVKDRAPNDLINVYGAVNGQM